MQDVLIRKPIILTITVELYQLQFNYNIKLPLTGKPVKGMLSALENSYCKIKYRINSFFLSFFFFKFNHMSLRHRKTQTYAFS